MYVYNACTFWITTNYSIHDSLDFHGTIRGGSRFNEEIQSHFLKATILTSKVLFDAIWIFLRWYFLHSNILWYEKGDSEMAMICYSMMPSIFYHFFSSFYNIWYLYARLPHLIYHLFFYKWICIVTCNENLVYLL